MTVYYQDDHVTLYHGDCREITAWLQADVLVTDPPYGRDWKGGTGPRNANGQGRRGRPTAAIAGDKDTSTRDSALAMWGDHPAIVYGDPLAAQPQGARQALIWHKPADSGIKGARVGFRRDVEMIYLVGPWPLTLGGESSVLTSSRWVAGPSGPAAIHGHPHSKPTDLMERLVALMPGVVADPFAGSGSTLAAAKALGRQSIGVELEERYCEIIARRLAQDVLDFGEGA